MEITAIIILSAYSIATSYFIYKLIRREEVIEEYYEETIQLVESKLINVKLKMEETIDQLSVIDQRGSFEADDEVGFTFKEIKKLNEELLQFILEYNKTDQNA
jgi:hypothetical protein